MSYDDGYDHIHVVDRMYTVKEWIQAENYQLAAKLAKRLVTYIEGVTVESLGNLSLENYRILLRWSVLTEEEIEESFKHLCSDSKDSIISL